MLIIAENKAERQPIRGLPEARFRDRPGRI